MKYLVAFTVLCSKGHFTSRAFIEEDRPISENIILNWETIRLHGNLKPYYGDPLSIKVLSFQQVTADTV